MLSLIDQFTGLLIQEMPEPAAHHMATREPGQVTDEDRGRQERLFAELAADFAGSESGDGPAWGPGVDPVLQRLFPDAYPHDPAASREFRRFTQSTQRNAKVRAATQVMADIDHLEGQGRCSVPDDHVDSWLTTLTNLRLALAVRLDIQDADEADRLAELPEDDPRAWVFSIYEWLGWVQESLLDCLE